MKASVITVLRNRAPDVAAVAPRSRGDFATDPVVEVLSGRACGAVDRVL